MKNKTPPTLKHFFYYVENTEEIRQKWFNTLLRRLDKPLFSFEERFAGSIIRKE